MGGWLLAAVPFGLRPDVGIPGARAPRVLPNVRAGQLPAQIVGCGAALSLSAAFKTSKPFSGQFETPYCQILPDSCNIPFFRRRRVNEPRNEPRIVTDNLTHRLEVCGNRRCPEPSGNGSCSVEGESILVCPRATCWLGKPRVCVDFCVDIFTKSGLYEQKGRVHVPDRVGQPPIQRL